MGVTVTGALSTQEMLMQLDTTLKRRSVALLIHNAKKVQEIAKQMAPRDEGNLEDAIKVDVTNARDDLGRFARREVTVYIDMDQPVPERPGVMVGDYAYEVHEHVTPMGTKNLGEESQRKQGQSQYTVGGGFMTRAAEEIDAELNMTLAELINSL